MINNADLFPQPSMIIFIMGTNNSDHVCRSIDVYNVLLKKKKSPAEHCCRLKL